MGTGFLSVSARAFADWPDIEALAPENPFATRAYAHALHLLGAEVAVVGQHRDGTLEAGCLARFRRGCVTTSLEIESLPRPAAPEAFWRDLFAYCRRERIAQLSAGTFASPPTSIPHHASETSRAARREFLLYLDRDSVLASGHKRNRNRALAAGIAVQETTSLAAGIVHAGLIRESLDRRVRRHEAVAASVNIQTIRALLEAGAARIYQAHLGGRALASVLVLLAARGAYYHSAGASPDGMKHGASHLLASEIAERLRAAGLVVFNLGGAPAGSGLARFKQGFGATPIELERATFFPGPRWRRYVSHWATVLPRPKLDSHAHWTLR
jgi:hypothetical protein